jgi:cholesterol oxidase
VAERSRVLYDFKHWSERTVIALVMQSLDNSINTFPKRTRADREDHGSEQGHGAPNPTWIPAGQRGGPPDGRIVGGVPGRATSASSSSAR